MIRVLITRLERKACLATLTDLLVESLFLCVALPPSSPGPFALVALSAVPGAFGHAHAGAQAAPAGPCDPKKTQQSPLEVCLNNPKFTLVTAFFSSFKWTVVKRQLELFILIA